jgi:DNA-binding CsgD family transcriptional regulator
MLTKRQRVVFAAYVLMGGKRAAVHLDIKLNTVHDTVLAVYRKLGVQNKREAMSCLGWKLQLIEINESVGISSLIID